MHRCFPGPANVGNIAPHSRKDAPMNPEQAMSSPTPSADATGNAIIVLSRDLFFGMRVRTVARQLGLDLTLTNDESSTVDVLAKVAPVLALVDFNQPVNWSALGPLLSSRIPVIAFGAHTDVDGFRAARSAGVDRVVSNGELSRNLPALIAKYRSE